MRALDPEGKARIVEEDLDPAVAGEQLVHLRLRLVPVAVGVLVEEADELREPLAHRLVVEVAVDALEGAFLSVGHIHADDRVDDRGRVVEVGRDPALGLEREAVLLGPRALVVGLKEELRPLAPVREGALRALQAPAEFLPQRVVGSARLVADTGFLVV